ncbi:MAG: TonB C-terminal domain-containing protein [Acidobacteria bacterium]|nr:TonB C-terminal domain-containing protein [Acidobacteriota bacterium]
MKMNLEVILEKRREENKPPVWSVFFSFSLHVLAILGIVFGANLFMGQPKFTPFISASLIPAKGLPDFRPARSSGKESVKKTEPAAVKQTETKSDAIKLPTLEKDKNKKIPEKKETTKKTSTTKENMDTKKTNERIIDRGDRESAGNKDGQLGQPFGTERGVGSGDGSISSMGFENFEFTWYQADVANQLSNNFVKSIASNDMRGISVVARFVIHSDGRITDIYLVKKCNIFALDQEVIRAIQNSSPLPPLPKQYTKEYLVAQYEFVY